MSADELFSGCDEITYSYDATPWNRSVTIEAHDSIDRWEEWSACLGTFATLATSDHSTFRFFVTDVLAENGRLLIRLQSHGAPLEPKEANP